MKFSKLLKRTLLRTLRPGRMIKAIKLQKRRKKVMKYLDDPQLKMVSEFLTSDMLHFGYFDDIDIRAEKISIRDLEIAQIRYTDLFFEHISDSTDPILDVGCGMGGLSSLLEQKGYAVEALTPNRHQIKYISEKYKNIRLIQSKYEDYPDAVPKYGTILNAESFQSIKDLNKAFEMTDQLILPGGKWIICDYFRKGESIEKSGHMWDEFLTVCNKFGWEIVHQQDITENILPTVKYLYMIGSRFIIPLRDYLLKKYEIKQPGLFFLTQEIADEISSKMDFWLEMAKPDRYTLEKKYMLLVLKKTAR
jgi:2-polyprenyl-3-methyl-5-hydroxy-6-metoxy-1,4-benzoquinol methylase